MQTIGSCLKSGREARNIRLSEVAQSTKISKWYLDCLEKDEFDKIPGGPYIKAYIASYASFIGIKEDEILKQYDSLQKRNADENEIEEHRPQIKKRQKLIGLAFSKKNLLILSAAVLIILVFGVGYYFFQNQTRTTAQIQDAPDSKMQSAASPKIKQGETRSVPKDSAADASDMTDLSKNNHLNPLKTGDKSHPTYQDAAETENLALLPLEQGSKKNDVKRPALTDSKNTLQQDTPRSVDSNSGSASGHRTPDAQSPAVSDMRVMRAVAASDVINRNPAGLSNSFQWSTEKVYIWTMIECDRPPASIRHTYYFEGQKVSDVELKIKSPQWRTWSYKTLLDKRYIGQWKVDITSAGGELLRSIFFEVH